MQRSLVGCLLLALVLASCASYNAMALNNLPVVRTQGQAEGDVTVVAKAFDKDDCKQYLDRDVIRAGYQPVQIYIQNDSDKAFLFAMDKVSLPCVPVADVAAKLYTSTAARVLGYGAGAVLFFPLVIPAVVDGFMSSNANDALNVDLASKVAHDQTILPHSYINKILFVSNRDYQPSLQITLVEAESGASKMIRVSTE